jgi:hypothetical protein
MHDADHPVRAAVRSHTDARRAFIEELVRAEGVADDATIEAISLLVEGTFALSAARRDPAVAVRASRTARRLMDGTHHIERT